MSGTTGTTVNGTTIPVSSQPFVANLQLATFDELTQRSINLAQSICPQFTDFSSGSPSLALMNVKAFTDIWLQWLVYTVFLNSRLFTSQGQGTDSFINDFGLSRLPAVSATGFVTFGRYTATNQMIVPIGAVVQTADGTQRFSVLSDLTNPLYNPTTERYELPVGRLTVDCLCQALNSGIQGNVQAGTITRPFTTVPGVNFTTNAKPFVNGFDGESDQHFKNRFVPYLNSRSTSTGNAIINAIQSVNPALTYQILENANGLFPIVDGDPNSGMPFTQFGFFTVYLDSGTTEPTDKNTVALVQQAINNIRPLSVDFWVTTPAVSLVNIEYLLAYESGYNVSVVDGIVKAEVVNYVNTLAPGETLNYFRLATIIDNTLGVKNIVALIVDGQKGNVGVGTGSIIKLGYLAFE